MTGKHGNHRRGPKVAYIAVECEVCGKVRSYLPSQVRVRGIIRFCSIACRNKGAIKNLVTVLCALCGKECIKRKDHLAKNQRAYCSKACASMARLVPGAKWRDREAIKAYMRAYVEKRRPELNERSRAWAKANRPKKTAASQRWRARLKTATVEVVNYERIMARDRMRCHICRKPVLRKDLHFDHVIPLAVGGIHGESNIAVAHGRCNVRKSAKVTTLF